jgi:hypothetical protein
MLKSHGLSLANSLMAVHRHALAPVAAKTIDRRFSNNPIDIQPFDDFPRITVQ